MAAPHGDVELRKIFAAKQIGNAPLVATKPTTTESTDDPMSPFATFTGLFRSEPRAIATTAASAFTTADNHGQGSEFFVLLSGHG